MLSSFGQQEGEKRQFAWKLIIKWIVQTLKENKILPLISKCFCSLWLKTCLLKAVSFYTHGFFFKQLLMLFPRRQVLGIFIQIVQWEKIYCTGAERHPLFKYSLKQSIPSVLWYLSTCGLYFAIRYFFLLAQTVTGRIDVWVSTWRWIIWKILKLWSVDFIIWTRIEMEMPSTCANSRHICFYSNAGPVWPSPVMHVSDLAFAPGGP